MIQLTLFESWQRHTRFPRDLVNILHSFLPTTEELFVEQRFRFLAKRTLTDADYRRECIDYADVIFVETPEYNAGLEIDIDRSLKTNKRHFKQMLTHWWTPKKSHPNYESDAFHVNFNMDKSEIPPITQETILDVLRIGYNVCLETATYQNTQSRRFVERENRDEPPLYAFDQRKDGVFPVQLKFQQFSTEREDGEFVFYPTPNPEVLHLLL
jgi:hypothetical protein